MANTGEDIKKWLEEHEGMVTIILFVVIGVVLALAGLIFFIAFLAFILYTSV
jgi:hypothetical protein